MPFGLLFFKTKSSIMGIQLQNSHTQNLIIPFKHHARYTWYAPQCTVNAHGRHARVHSVSHALAECMLLALESSLMSLVKYY